MNKLKYNNIYKTQIENSKVYSEYLNLLKRNSPFLPISFFKTHQVKTGNFKEEIVFSSSGTSGKNTSRHFVKNAKDYEDRFIFCFNHFYGDFKDYCHLALLPSYLERKGSSLVYMLDYFIKNSIHKESGFYLYNHDELANKLKKLEESGIKTILWGVTFALLDFAEKHSLKLKNTTLIETGGMKGRRKEMIREEVHDILKNAFGLEKIASEYGMTELLSQAYSKGDGIFYCPPGMEIKIRDVYDPFEILPEEKIGGINIIDTANINSCAFIETQDLGRLHKDGSFEVLGRIDDSDIRGCNLMA